MSNTSKERNKLSKQIFYNTHCLGRYYSGSLRPHKNNELGFRFPNTTGLTSTLLKWHARSNTSVSYRQKYLSRGCSQERVREIFFEFSIDFGRIFMHFYVFTTGTGIEV